MTSFGQAAFVGIAAYATAWLRPRSGAVAVARAGRSRSCSPAWSRAGHRRADAAPRRPLPAARHHRLGAGDPTSCSATCRCSASTTASANIPPICDRRLVARRAATHLLPDLGASSVWPWCCRPTCSIRAPGRAMRAPARRPGHAESMGIDPFRVQADRLRHRRAARRRSSGWLYAHMSASSARRRSTSASASSTC